MRAVLTAPPRGVVAAGGEEGQQGRPPGSVGMPKVMKYEVMKVMNLAGCWGGPATIQQRHQE